MFYASMTPIQRIIFIAHALSWGVLFYAGQAILGPPRGLAVAGFVWMFTAWWIPPRPKTRRSFAVCLCSSLAFALVGFGIGSLLASR